MSLASTENVASDALLPPPCIQTPLVTLVWLKHDRDLDASRIVENMFRHSSGPYGLTALTGCDASLGWGILLPKNYTPLTSWSVYSDGFELCLFDEADKRIAKSSAELAGEEHDTVIAHWSFPASWGLITHREPVELNRI